MLGDVLRLSWSISLGSLLPSSLRLRPSKLSRSEGDCGLGSSCCRKGKAIFPFAFPFSFLLDLGAPLHKTILPSQHTTVPNVSILAQTHSPAIWGVPQSPYTVSCSLAASLVSFLVKPIPSSRVHLKHLLPIPSWTQVPVSTSSYLPSSWILYPFNIPQNL